MSIDNLQQLTADLNDLEAKWAAANPARHAGGRNALIGFQYQHYLFLLELISQWLSFDADSKCDAEKFLASMEKVSDISCIDRKSNVIVITQVKNSLRTASLRESLDEFQTIIESARDVGGCLESRLRFRILTRKKNIKDVENGIESWADSRRERFGSQVDTIKRRCIIATESKPELRLLAILANRLSCPDPVPTINKWMGDLIASINNREALNLSVVHIWSDLQRLSSADAKTRSELYIWQDEDVPPQINLQGGVLTGQRPIINHLREGYFAALPRTYKSLSTEFESWIRCQSEQKNEKPLVFWIGGRSGSGKSVALLHLLSDLHEQGNSPLIWIGHRVQLLSSAFSFLLKSDSMSERSIIGVDDPYVINSEGNVTEYWDNLLAAMHVPAQQGNFGRLPIIVACGPTEQGEFFRDDYGDEFNIRIFQLPKEADDERAFLKAWYKERTGKEAPDINENNALMVQLFFEWQHHQSIFDFSKRLRERLTLGGRGTALVDRISRILALNRLYVGYVPKAVEVDLNIDEAEELHRLEEDLHLGLKENAGRQGYWLLHPHLANSIYLNWLEYKPKHRVHYLVGGILDSLKFGADPIERTEPIWALIRAFRQGCDETPRITDDEMINVIGSVYKLIMEINENSLPVWLLPPLVEVEALSLNVSFFKSPTEMAIAAVIPANQSEVGLRLTCHKLLQHLSKFENVVQNEIVRSISSMLQESVNWRHWIPVMDNLIKATRDPSLTYLIAKNNSAPRFDDNTARLLLNSLNIYKSDNNVCAIVSDYIADAPVTLSWGDVAKTIIQSCSDNCRSISYGWVRKNCLSEDIVFVLSECLLRDYSLFEEVAIEWAELWCHTKHASYIIEKIIKNQPGNSRVFDWCNIWMASNDGDPTYMLQDLIKQNPGSDKIVELSFEWLESARLNHKGWFYLWHTMRNSGADIKRLTSIIQGQMQYIEYENKTKWLKNVDPNHRGWNYAWESLYGNAADETSLNDIGLRWLEEVDANHSGWNYAWLFLYEKGYEKSRLNKFGLHWLEVVNPNHGGWNHVWLKLLENNYEKPRLYWLGLRWLEDASLNHFGWSYTWQHLHANYYEIPRLNKFGMRWLEEVDPNHRVWNQVWRCLYESEEDKTNLHELALIWLKKVDPNHGGWSHIWQAIYKNQQILLQIQVEMLLDIGQEWIRTVGADHPEWNQVWQSLVKSSPDNEELVLLGYAQVKRTTQCVSWAVVWRALRKACPDDSFLIEVARSWLVCSNNLNGEWIEVWESVIDNYSYDNELIGLAWKWLEKKTFNHGLWSNVWKRYTSTKGVDSRSLKLGLGWLKSNKSNPSMRTEVANIVNKAFKDGVVQK